MSGGMPSVRIHVDGGLAVRRQSSDRSSGRGDPQKVASNEGSLCDGFANEPASWRSPQPPLKLGIAASG